MKHQIKDGRTYFTLDKGTEFSFGSETIALEEKAEFSLDGELSRDAVVETIFASGNAAANSENVRSSETRDEVRDGKKVKVKYNINYGGRGQRIEQEDEVITESPKPKTPNPVVKRSKKTSK